MPRLLAQRHSSRPRLSARACFARQAHGSETKINQRPNTSDATMDSSWLGPPTLTRHQTRQGNSMSQRNCSTLAGNAPSSPDGTQEQRLPDTATWTLPLCKMRGQHLNEAPLTWKLCRDTAQCAMPRRNGHAGGPWPIAWPASPLTQRGRGRHPICLAMCTWRAQGPQARPPPHEVSSCGPIVVGAWHTPPRAP